MKHANRNHHCSTPPPPASTSASAARPSKQGSLSDCSTSRTCARRYWVEKLPFSQLMCDSSVASSEVLAPRIMAPGSDLYQQTAIHQRSEPGPRRPHCQSDLRGDLLGADSTGITDELHDLDIRDDQLGR